MRREVILNTTGLWSGYGGKPVLQGVDMQVHEGEIVAVIGRNGVGKSTLMKSLIGLLPTDKGSVVFRGSAIDTLSAHKRARLGIGYVPQGRDVFPRMSVLENLAIGEEISGKRAPKDRLDQIFSFFPILAERRDQRAGTMSGGQQQQLAIARALVTDPKVLLLDEPTEGIQPSIIKDIARALNEIRKLRGITIVVSEQVLSFAMDVADRLLVIEGGRLVHETRRSETNEQLIKSYLSV